MTPRSALAFTINMAKGFAGTKPKPCAGIARWRTPIPLSPTTISARSLRKAWPGVPTTAAQWYAKAAEQGDAYGESGLGLLYPDGHGVARDYATALRLFHAAADQGSASAMVSIGYMYDWGWGVDQDSGEAMRWQRRGAELGDRNGQYGVGLFYAACHGVQRDMTHARFWIGNPPPRATGRRGTG
jgi:TPR repeat protein